MSKSVDKFTKAALSGLVALTSASLTCCGSSAPIACHGVARNPVAMTAGQCHKLAGGRVHTATAQQRNSYHAPSSASYIKCYGVAAAGKNDCGTKTTACAGSVHTAKRADAWIAFPDKLCAEVGGKVVRPATKHSAHSKAKTSVRSDIPA